MANSEAFLVTIFKSFSHTFLLPFFSTGAALTLASRALLFCLVTYMSLWEGFLSWSFHQWAHRQQSFLSCRECSGQAKATSVAQTSLCFGAKKIKNKKLPCIIPFLPDQVNLSRGSGSHQMCAASFLSLNRCFFALNLRSMVLQMCVLAIFWVGDP